MKRRRWTYWLAILGTLSALDLAAAANSDGHRIQENGEVTTSKSVDVRTPFFAPKEMSRSSANLAADPPLGEKNDARRDWLAVRRVLVTVVVVFGLGALAASIVYKKRAEVVGRGGDIELLSTLSLAPRCCLHLVQACGQTVLVARDSTGIKNVLFVEKDFESYLDGNEQDAPNAYPIAAERRIHARDVQ